VSKVRHIDFYPDEWLAGTATLDIVDVGIYITACAMIYSHGGSVEKSELKRFVRCHGKAFENALDRLVVAGKLTLNGSQIASKRCVNELENARKRIGSSVENGRKGGRPPKKINDIEKPDGFFSKKLTTNYQLEDSVETSVSTAPSGASESIADPVKDLFDRGRKALGPKSGALLGKMRREYGDVAVVEAIVACEDNHPSDPAAFFVRCLKIRAPPNTKNGSRHYNTPAATMLEGAYLAAEAFIARNQGNLRADSETDEPLLDCGGTNASAAGPTRRLARRPH
jgi:hypothetical protein